MRDTYESLNAMLGDEEQMFGRNSADENVIVECYEDYVLTVTFQRNDWVRKNFYYSDGTVEELYTR